MELSPKKYALVAMNLPVEGFFTYEIPLELEDSIVPGMRVLAPFGRRVVTGYVVALEKGKPCQRNKEIARRFGRRAALRREKAQVLSMACVLLFCPSRRGLFFGPSFRSRRKEPEAFQDNGKRKGIFKFRENSALRLRRSYNRDSFRDRGFYKPSVSHEKVQEGLSLLDPFPA